MKATIKMKALNVDIPADLHTDVKKAAVHDETPMKDWVAAALRYRLAQRKKKASSSDDESLAQGFSSSSKPKGERAKSAVKKPRIPPQTFS